MLFAYLGGKRPRCSVEHPVLTGGTNRYGHRVNRIKKEIQFHSIFSYTTVLYHYGFWLFNLFISITTYTEQI